jgi:hypothetical protein
MEYMSDYDNTNTGALFKNDQKGNDKAPNAKGTLNVNGVEYWISAWTKTSKAGTKYQSLSIQPKEAQPEKKPEPKNVQGAHGGSFDDMSDDIPFSHHGSNGEWRII